MSIDTDAQNLGLGFDISGLTPLLVAVDLGLIAVFILMGEIHHGFAPTETFKTVIPFFVGWVGVAPFLGAYSHPMLGSYSRTVIHTFVAWILAAGIAQVLRATSAFPNDNASVAFFLVSLGFGTALLVPWRLAYAYKLKN